MAISGSFYGTTGNSAIKPKITWSAEENIEGNYSDVTATLSYSRTDSYKTYGYWAGSLTINGNKKSVSGKYVEITKNSNTVAVSYTVQVPHDDDGTKTVTVSADGAISGTTLTKTTISGSVTLTSIPRAASVAATDADIGSVSMVTIGKKSDIYTYTVAYRFGELSGYLSEAGLADEAVSVTAASLAFPVPESFYYEIPAKASDICTLTCTTFLDGSPIGEAQQTTFTVRADPARCAPLLSVSAEDINSDTLALTGDKISFVRYVSTALCTVSAQSRYGAQITERKLNGETVTGDTVTLEAVQVDALRFTAKDSRGYTTEVTLVLNLLPYFVPSFRLSAARTDATSGEAMLNAEGSFYHGSFGLTANSLRLQYRINDGEAVEVEPELDGSSFRLQQLLEELDYTQSYSVRVTASDALSSQTVTARINPGIPVFDWGKADFAFHAPVSLSGNQLKDLADPTDDADAVNLGYANRVFAPVGDYLTKCTTVKTTGTDLNDYTQEGWYFFASTYKPTNIPVGVNGWLHVLNNTVGSNTYIKQLWYRAGTPGTNDFHSYVRTYTTAGGWSAWSKYITENDAVRIVKLWENASPSSTFAAQTLSLDLSGYDAVMIFFHNASDSTIYLSTGMIPIGYKTTLAYTTTSGAIYSRPATASSTGIVFEAGQTGTTSGAKYCVPVRIYGIKGVA